MPSKKTFQCSQLERHREALASENQTCQLIIPRHGSNHSQFRRLEYLHQNDDLQTHHQTLASKKCSTKDQKTYIAEHQHNQVEDAPNYV